MAHMRCAIRSLVVSLALVLAALTAAAPTLANGKGVIVVNLGFHTGIAVRVADLDPRELPEVFDFQGEGSEWIEFGWGDAEFYQTPEPEFSTILAAAFLKTPAVMHLVGLPVEPQRYFSNSSFLRITLTDQQFEKLITYLSDSFDRTGGDRVQSIGKGLYPVSRFYPAVGSFSLSNSCNTWVVRAFEHAGLDVEADGVMRASEAFDALSGVSGAAEVR